MTTNDKAKELCSGGQQHPKPVLQPLGPPRPHSQDTVSVGLITLGSPGLWGSAMVTEWLLLAGSWVSPSSPVANTFRAKVDSHLSLGSCSVLAHFSGDFNMLRFWCFWSELPCPALQRQKPLILPLCSSCVFRFPQAHPVDYMLGPSCYSAGPLNSVIHFSKKITF